MKDRKEDLKQEPIVVSQQENDTNKSLREFMGKMVLKQRNWRERHFPDEVEKQLMETQADLVAQGGKQLLKNNELMGEIIFQSLMNVGNNKIQREAGWLERDGQEEFIKSHRMLTEAIGDFRKYFAQEFRAECKELSKLDSERERKIMEDFLFGEFESTIEMIQGMLASHRQHSFRPIS